MLCFVNKTNLISIKITTTKESYYSLCIGGKLHGLLILNIWMNKIFQKFNPVGILVVLFTDLPINYALLYCDILIQCKYA